MFVSSSIVASRIYALFVVKSTRVPRLGGGAGGSSQSRQCQDSESFCYSHPSLSITLLGAKLTSNEAKLTPNGPQSEARITKSESCLTHSEAGLIHSRMLASVGFANIILHPDAVNLTNIVVTPWCQGGGRSN